MQNFTVHRVAQIDSTNTRLLEWASQQNCHGVLLVADEQTAGRGQRGRTWVAAPGDALLCSIAWQFPRTQALDGLSLAVGVMVAEALGGATSGALRLKWPNDLLVAETHKLGGILIETVASPGDTRTAVIGIGINLRPPALAASSAALPVLGLDQCNQQFNDRDTILGALLPVLTRGLKRFADGGFAAFRDPWWTQRAFAQAEVLVRFPDGQEVAGWMVDVTDRGALVVESARGKHTFVSGEVSLRAVGA